MAVCSINLIHKHSYVDVIELVGVSSFVPAELDDKTGEKVPLCGTFTAFANIAFYEEKIRSMIADNLETCW